MDEATSLKYWEREAEDKTKRPAVTIAPVDPNMNCATSVLKVVAIVSRLFR